MAVREQIRRSQARWCNSHADAPAPGERTLQGSMQGILMEVARMLDEQKR